MRAILNIGTEGEYDIQVDGKRYHFEWHRVCGPIWLTSRGEPRAKQPEAFLKAASLWAQQGKRVEDGLCRWDHKPEIITEHIAGRHYRFVGYTQPVKGE